jgi:predicted small integral membrane protein
MLLVLYGLTRVEHSGPVAIDVLGPAGAGAGLLLVFVAWERRAAAPLVRLGILQVKSLRGASLGVGANAAAFTSVVYVGTLYFQTALGYSPLQAGLAHPADQPRYQRAGQRPHQPQRAFHRA